MPDSVIIDGVRYVPDTTVPNNMSVWYMHDNHTFTRLYGTTLDEILEQADVVESESSYGMLCEITLLCNTKEIRRVGTTAHSRSSKDSKDHWNAGKAEWRRLAESDIDVIRLLPLNVKEERPQHEP